MLNQEVSTSEMKAACVKGINSAANCHLLGLTPRLPTRFGEQMKRNRRRAFHSHTYSYSRLSVSGAALCVFVQGCLHCRHISPL